MSLHLGFIATSEVFYSSIVTNWKFFVRVKKIGYVYAGVKILANMNVNISNNIFSNLSCTPFHLNSFILRSGVLTIIGDEGSIFLENDKRTDIHGNFFENCDCEYGGALFISKHHIVHYSKNVFMNNSATLLGGSICFLISNRINLTNTLVIDSFCAQSSGSIYFSNINAAIVYYYIDLYSKAKTAASWEVADSFLNCKNLSIFYGLTEGQGGFAFVRQSDFVLDVASIGFIKSDGDGGVFFLEQGSNLRVTNIDVLKYLPLMGPFLQL